MNDIFLSYAHEDQQRTIKLAQALEAQGWTVFYDRTLSAGSTWRESIGQVLETAGCVVVVWSKHSIASHWVVEEADDGQMRKVLVPVLFDQVRPPIGFRSIQAADLINWKGDLADEAFRYLLNSIAKIIGTPKVIGRQPNVANNDESRHGNADLQHKVVDVDRNKPVLSEAERPALAGVCAPVMAHH